MVNSRGFKSYPGVKLYDINGQFQTYIKSSTGFLSQRMSFVAALAFHPYNLQLAVGGRDQCISIFGSEEL
jgi:hypothetical protein